MKLMKNREKLRTGANANPIEILNAIPKEEVLHCNHVLMKKMIGTKFANLIAILNEECLQIHRVLTKKTIGAEINPIAMSTEAQVAIKNVVLNET
jgi:hypothetical protein